MGLGDASNYWYGCFLGTVNVGTAIKAGGSSGFAMAGVAGSAVVTIDDNAIGFFGATPLAKQTGGPQTAGLFSYGPTEGYMLQTVYDALRNYGLLT